MYYGGYMGTTTALTLRFIVPLICSMVNGAPKCNTLNPPTKTSESTWYEPTTNSTIELIDGKLIIKAE